MYLIGKALLIASYWDAIQIEKFKLGNQLQE